jgi:UDPglucose 6-dehydrogenase/GDP-mannose 6-dehydrogenase
VSYSESLNDAINQVDVIMIVTRWPEFEALPHLLTDSVNNPVVIDGRRMLDKNLIKSYAGIGL